jgi:hypothetical protein
VCRNSTDVQGTRVVQVCWDTVVLQGYRSSTGVQWVQGYYRGAGKVQGYRGTGVLEKFRSRTGLHALCRTTWV